MSTMIGVWGSAFALTSALELPLVVALTRESGIDWRRRALLAFFGQLATHPLVWFAFPAIPELGPVAAFTLAEIFAWLCEAAFYATTGVTKRPLAAIGVSGIANALSLGVSLSVRF
jgi:hypothetical protein